MNSNNFKNNLLIVLLVFSATMSCAQSKSTFYNTPTEHKITKNLVTDFGVDNDFATNDSDKLQKAIHTISKSGGGQLIVPKGNYTFSDIEMQSNVHVVFDSEVVIRPSKRENKKNFVIFSFGKNSDVVENISFTCSNPNKKYTVDLTQTNNYNVAVFALRNIDGFLFSDVLIKDVQTRFSSFTLGITPFNGDYFYPRNGVIENTTTTNADYGYGLIQSQAAKNVHFKNLGGEGGITLRLETGEKKMNNLQIGGNHDILANNIACNDGNAAVMISPHAMQNGIVTIDGVTAINCGFGVRVGGAFISKKYKQDIGLKLGAYDPSSSVKNVIATFGRSSQVKPKHMMYIPLIYQTKEYTATTPITNTFCNPRATKDKEARISVSVAAIGYFSGKGVVCEKEGKKKKRPATYTVNIDESTVKSIGFKDQKAVIDLRDDVLSKCTYLD